VNCHWLGRRDGDLLGEVGFDLVVECGLAFMKREKVARQVQLPELSEKLYSQPWFVDVCLGRDLHPAPVVGGVGRYDHQGFFMKDDLGFTRSLT
jgi:hypothetical protein